MNEGELAVFIPAMRPQLIGKLIDNLMACTPITPHVYVMSHLPEVLAAVDGYPATAWDDHELRSWGARLNDCYERTTEPYFFLGADDVMFDRDWYRPARAVMERVDGVVAVNDCWNGSGTLALVSRRYIEQHDGTVDHTGPVIHQGYSHNFSETELAQTAKRRGRFAYCRDAIVEHFHPLWGRADWDEVYILGGLHAGEDEALFKSRQHLWA